MGKADLEDIFNRIEEWRVFLANHPMPINEGLSVPIKFTAGVACFPLHGTSVEEVSRCADLALYQAKERGRNCTVLFEALE